MTTSGLPPIDGNACSAYTSEGRRHFDRVVRSRNVLVRNANDLVALLDDAERDILHALALMESGPVASPTLDEETRQALLAEAEAYRQEFWPTLDQRLHNLVASVASLVDQTRPLVDFYSEEPAFQQEFRRRNDVVAGNPRSKFVRRLRNYLVHAGVAPLMQSTSLVSDPNQRHLARDQALLSRTAAVVWLHRRGAPVHRAARGRPAPLPDRRRVRDGDG